MKLETLFLSLIVIAITAYYFAMRRAVDSVNSQKAFQNCIPCRLIMDIMLRYAHLYHQ